MSGVGELPLRANPGYELVLLDRLRPAERQLLAELGEDDAYGMLRPRRGSALEARTASADTALLFLTPAEAGPVLDGVLELAHDGSHVSGPAAAPLLDNAATPGGAGRVAALSAAALRYGELLGPIE